MIGRETFDDALDSAIDQVRSGMPLADVLAAHPKHAAELRPLVETSAYVAVAGRTAVAPLSRGLADNVTIVRAALERERMAARVQPARDERMERPASSAPWWARRWSIASLSLPAGVVVFAALAGAGGAAAATVTAANSDVASQVASIVTPDWAQNLVPESLSGDDGPGASGARGGEDGPQSPPENGEIVHVTLSGVVEDAHGGNFILRSGDETWNVQIDVNTNIDGAVLDGANATVSGAQTGEQTLHAEDIDASGGATPTPKPGNGGPPATPPGQGNTQPEATPNKPGQNKTPNPNASSPTPGIQDEQQDQGDDGEQDEDGDQGAMGEQAPPDDGSASANENSNFSNGGGPRKP